MTGVSGSLPSGGLQRVQLFSGAKEAPGCSSISWRMKGVREFIEKITSAHRMPGEKEIYLAGQAIGELSCCQGSGLVVSLRTVRWGGTLWPAGQ